LFLVPWIRCYHRLSIFIAFFAIFAVILLLDRIRIAYFEGPRRQGIFIFGMVAILIIGIRDQTNRTFVFPYQETAAQFHSDRDFVHQIESRIPGQAVFQLPYAPFPEFGVQDMNCYDHMRGYLHSQTLRWSGGAVKGRSAAFWQSRICAQPAGKMLTSLVLAGFKGLYLDRFGYADRGRALENDLKEILHQQPLVSQNQRLVFFDLSEYERSLRSRLGIIEWQLRREEELIPLAVYPAWQGFGPLEGTPQENWRWCSGKGKLEIRNIGSEPRTVVLQMAFEGNGRGARSTPRPRRLVLPNFSTERRPTLLVATGLQNSLG